jgi:hypothetical protein
MDQLYYCTFEMILIALIFHLSFYKVYKTTILTLHQQLYVDFSPTIIDAPIAAAPKNFYNNGSIKKLKYVFNRSFARGKKKYYLCTFLLPVLYQ